MSSTVDQHERAGIFRSLHVPGHPLILFNIWDAGSAKAVADAGALALATGSWSVAAAHGYADGEKLPLDLALENVRRIVSSSELPVTFDIESGYGTDAVAVGHTTSRAIETGVVGCNIEDSYPESGKLRPVADQVARLRSARAATKRGLDSLFINARTDVFFQAPANEHSRGMLEMAIDRAKAYADAGADGLFAPGLIDPVLIAELASSTSLPVNIMIGEGSPSIASLAAAGVARVSHGPGPYLSAMTTLATAARSALQYAP
ncbi:MAG TPA: isocitrate lyase/phosphoenolpyruvate mutase family protein [Gemmatimonadaceae bacterium]|nr:isocitrate lyase/phosphoenolpyruvate mutase family protein [Gemmatimonadaceae bacterium]